MELHIFKNSIVGQETDQRSLFAGVAQDFQRAGGLAGFDLMGRGIFLGGEGHFIMRPVEIDVDGEPAAEGVDHAGAHAVETAGIGVIVVAELAAGVQHGEDNLDPGDAHGGVRVDRHAAAIVPHAGRSVFVQGHVYFIGETVGRFVDGIVHDFPQKMMETAGRGGSDIHAGAHTDGFEALEDLDVPGVIGLRGHAFTPWFV